jgi:ketosteroid isomerase-like protein
MSPFWARGQPVRPAAIPLPLLMYPRGGNRYRIAMYPACDSPLRRWIGRAPEESKPASIRGEQAVRGFWSDFLDIFDQVTVSPEEFIDLGDRVVMPNRTHMRSREGIEVQTQSAVVVTLRHRRIVRWCLYQEKAEALEAVRLRE